jgi:hypothetical protein
MTVSRHVEEAVASLRRPRGRSCWRGKAPIAVRVKGSGWRRSRPTARLSPTSIPMITSPFMRSCTSWRDG